MFCADDSPCTYRAAMPVEFSSHGVLRIGGDEEVLLSICKAFVVVIGLSWS